MGLEQLGLSESAAKYLVWLIRALIPTILFFVWYVTQPPDAKQRYARKQLLAVREVLLASGDACKAPPELRSLRLGACETPKADTAGGASGRVARKRNNSGNAAPPPPSHGSPGLSPSLAPAKVPEADMPETLEEQPAIAEEMDIAHLESLLKFVAFRHKEHPQRYFLPSDEQPPPPPRRLPPQQKEVSERVSAKANAEAQTMLKGLSDNKFGLNRHRAVQDIEDKLISSKAIITQDTFRLFIHLCVDLEDLPAASGFLAKMEACGYAADAEQLDKVMELYAASSISRLGRKSSEQEDSTPSTSTPSGLTASGSPGRCRDAPWNKARGGQKPFAEGTANHSIEEELS